MLVLGRDAVGLAPAAERLDLGGQRFDGVVAEVLLQDRFGLSVGLGDVAALLGQAAECLFVGRPEPCQEGGNLPVRAVHGALQTRYVLLAAGHQAHVVDADHHAAHKAFLRPARGDGDLPARGVVFGDFHRRARRGNGQLIAQPGGVEAVEGLAPLELVLVQHFEFARLGAGPGLEVLAELAAAGVGVLGQAEADLQAFDLLGQRGVQGHAVLRLEVLKLTSQPLRGPLVPEDFVIQPVPIAGLFFQPLDFVLGRQGGFQKALLAFQSPHFLLGLLAVLGQAVSLGAGILVLTLEVLELR